MKNIGQTFSLVTQELKETLSRSGIHGFPSLMSEQVSRIIKITWIVIMLLSWGFFAYQAYGTVSFYDTYPKVTQIFIASDPVVDFPGNLNASCL